MKYTAIYIDSWMAGSHIMTLTKMMRVEIENGESVLEMLRRNKIDDSTVFLFEGHPKMQGE